MKAIVDINGKQYEIEEGRYLQVDSFAAQENDQVVLGNVCMIVAGEQSIIGAPYIEGATVKATVKRHARGPKLLVYKMRCKKGYRRKNGHRQGFSELQVELIDFAGRDKFPKAEKTESASKAPRAQKTETPNSAVDTPKQTKTASKKAAPKKDIVSAESTAAKKPAAKKAPAKKAEKPAEMVEATTAPEATSEE